MGGVTMKCWIERKRDQGDLFWGHCDSSMKDKEVLNWDSRDGEWGRGENHCSLSSSSYPSSFSSQILQVDFCLNSFLLHTAQRGKETFLRPHSSSVTKVGLAYRNLDPFPTTFPNPLYTFKGRRRRTELNLPSGSLCSPWRNSNLDSALTGFGIKMCESWSSLLRARDQGAFRVEGPRLGLWAAAASQALSQTSGIRVKDVAFKCEKSQPQSPHCPVRIWTWLTGTWRVYWILSECQTQC